jgi:hypothetical protein
MLILTKNSGFYNYISTTIKFFAKSNKIFKNSIFREKILQKATKYLKLAFSRKNFAKK